MKIILSGGWGYGNLGDDAIMLSSVKQLYNNHFQEVTISIVTNSPIETSQVLNIELKVEIIKSFYADLFEDIRQKHSFGLKSKAKEMFKQRITNRIFDEEKKIALDFLKSPDEFIRRHNSVIKPFENLCKSSDVYIMSGGGYLNDWVEMGIVKYIESYVASKNGLKCYMVGQTIGPFRFKYSFDLVKSVCHLMKKIYYRDTESVKDGRRMNIPCKLMPDIALSENARFEKKNQIVIIPFDNKIITNANVIVANLKEIVDDKAKIIVSVSQLWQVPINIALHLYSLLVLNGITAELRIPRNAIELQRILGESKLVISQNLHGLILAYRSYTPIVSLNSGRKFASFMDMIGKPNLIIEPNEIHDKELYNKAELAMSDNYESSILSVKGKIKVVFDELFE